ncbi:glycoside hydrolase family 95 protein, partial [Paenibacillus sepulcri]|nr:glycoside hydrolase family 95 protein [Paenibacillus sepulcri]
MKKLHYKQPAHSWVEALPIGNGRLGGMIFSGVEQERIQLNEDTLWSGSPREFNNPHALEVLPEVRRLLAEENFMDAYKLSREMLGPYTQSYLPLGDLHLQFYHGDIAGSYERSLDIERALSCLTYQIGEVTYTRETFASYPDQAIIMRLQADRPGMISFSARLTSQLRSRTSQEDQQHVLHGTAPENVDPSYYPTDRPIVYGDSASNRAMSFTGRLGAVNTGGTLHTDADGLHVSDADSVTLFFGAATSFQGFDRIPSVEGRNPAVITKEQLSAAMIKSYEELLKSHVDDYRRLFDRVDIHLGNSSAAASVPTDRRIEEFGAADPALVELLFHYGRYLMIASSRQDSQPANLQGIWNQEVRPPWSSNYTININTQMNYWPVESCNLSECHEPLLQIIENLSVNGASTAKVNYGVRGWTAHHNTDIWCLTSPAGDYGHGDPLWALWPMGAAWLCQ